MDEIDHKLARISGRLEARRRELQRRLDSAPDLARHLADLRDTFGPIAISYVRVGDWEDGDPARIYEIDGRPGWVVRAPAPYHPPASSRRGQAARMRAREAIGR